MALFFELTTAMQFHANFLFDTTKYKGHSFRIGAATFAADVVLLMPKFGQCVGGNPTLFLSIFGGPGLCSTA